MRVVLVYREPNVEACSIEELFQTIALEMRKEVEVIEYKVGNRYQVLADIWRLRKLRADIYHITGAVHYMVCLLPWAKTVLTVHDLVYYQYTLKGIKRYIYKWLWLMMPIYLAKRVTTVSDATAKEIRAKLGFGNKYIEVIPNCCNVLFQPVAKQFNTQYPTVFQIGTLPHKNVLNLIKALNGIPCRLVLIGHLDDMCISQLKILQIQYENFIGISMREIYQHYINSDIVTFISLREGFGIPIIEAQAVGRLVITTNYAPMSDVAGDGACLVNPLSVADIHNALLKIINDSGYRNSVIERGFANVKHYSVSTVTQRYLNVYQHLLL